MVEKIKDRGGGTACVMPRYRDAANLASLAWPASSLLVAALTWMIGFNPKPLRVRPFSR